MDLSSSNVFQILTGRRKINEYPLKHKNSTEDRCSRLFNEIEIIGHVLYFWIILNPYRFQLLNPLSTGGTF